MWPLILPTSVLLKTTGGDKIPTFVGTSSNMVSKVLLVSVEQKLILDSVLMLFNASNVAKLPKDFPMGEAFTKKIRKAKNRTSHLQNEDKHIIRALPCFMPIHYGPTVTVKGTSDKVHHDHMHRISQSAKNWLETMAGLGSDKIAFNSTFETAILADKSALGAIIHNVLKGKTFMALSHVDLIFVTANMEEDDLNLAADINSLKAEV